MIIIISPAKKMNMDSDYPIDCQRPLFLQDTQYLCQHLQGMNRMSLQKLWKCNDSLTELNFQRLQTMNLEQNLTPALFSYEGIQYRYMAPHVLERGHLDYLNQHLRILLGFYGLLRPFDGVTPYRLEMGAKLKLAPHRDLYGFWGSRLADQLATEGEWILNLASKEYSRGIQPHLPKNMPFITCIFGEEREGKVIEKGTMCKMARGQMVRWLAEHEITHSDRLKDFNQLGYIFSPEYSDATRLVFVKTAHKR